MSHTLCVRGENLIKSFEKLAYTAYQDEGGVWTIGFGHTGPEVVEGLVWTYLQVEAAFIADTQAAVAANNAMLPPSINQNQFDALVSFAFNVGVNAEGHSTLLRKINAGDLPGAADEFKRWNHVNGVVSAGLTERRDAERALFVSLPSAA